MCDQVFEQTTFLDFRYLLGIFFHNHGDIIQIIFEELIFSVDILSLYSYQSDLMRSTIQDSLILLKNIFI